MIKITASDVNNLRKISGAGIMECKNALVEANGDTETAIEFLRKKGHGNNQSENITNYKSTVIVL